MKHAVDLLVGAALLLAINSSSVIANDIDHSYAMNSKTIISSDTTTDHNLQLIVVDYVNRADANAANVQVTLMNLPNFDMPEVISTAYAFGIDSSAVGDLAAPVPEPGTIVLLSAGILVLAVYFRRRMSGLPR